MATKQTNDRKQADKFGPVPKRNSQGQNVLGQQEQGNGGFCRQHGKRCILGLAATIIFCFVSYMLGMVGLIADIFQIHGSVVQQNAVQVQSAPVPDLNQCKKKFVIQIIKVSEKTNAKKARQYKAKLLSAEYTVEGPHDNEDPTDRPEVSQVRYFYAEDFQSAKLVARDISEVLGIEVDVDKGESDTGAPGPKGKFEFYLK